MQSESAIAPLPAPLPLSAPADAARTPPLPSAPPDRLRANASAKPLTRDAVRPTPPPAKLPTGVAGTRAATSSASASAPVRQEPHVVPAVVLDEALPRTSRAPAAAASTVAASAAAALLPVGAPAPKPGAGLIAITADGKLAVFTNPHTGLPQQFKLGEQLPAGDTIRSIDAGQGRVVSTTREYILD